MDLGRVQAIILALLLIALPLMPPIWQYEQSKLIYFVLVLMIVALMMIYKLTLEDLKIRISKIKFVGLLFLLILFVTSVTGIDPRLSLLGGSVYRQGFIVYFGLVLWSLMISGLRFNLDLFKLVLSIGYLILGIATIFDFIGLQLGYSAQSYAGRIVTGFGQPNFLSLWMICGLPFIYFCKILGRFKWLIIAVVFTATLMTFSKLAIAILMGLTFILLLTNLNSVYQKALLSLTILSILISVLVSVKTESGLVWDLMLSSQSVYTRTSAESRLNLYQVFLKAQPNPLTGVGLENQSKLWGEYFRSIDFNSNANSLYLELRHLNVDRGHSYFLDIYLSSGLVGLILYLILLIILLKTRTDPAIKVSLIIYLIYSSFHNLSIANLIFFWLLVGLIDNQFFKRTT